LCVADNKIIKIFVDENCSVIAKLMVKMIEFLELVDRWLGTVENHGKKW